MRIKKTNQEIVYALTVFRTYTTGEEKGTRLASILRRQSKLFGKKLVKYEEDCEDERITLASVDDKRNIMRDANSNYVFTPENLLKLTKRHREFGLRTVDVDIMYNKTMVEEDCLKNEGIRDFLIDFLEVEQDSDKDLSKDPKEEMKNENKSRPENAQAEVEAK